jgi:hypothetical protein
MQDLLNAGILCHFKKQQVTLLQRLAVVTSSKFEFVAVDKRQPTRLNNVVGNADGAPVILMIR